MAGTYEQLLDATIQHLEDLKSRGVRHVAVSSETFRALAQPVQTISAAAQQPAQISQPMTAPKISTPGPSPKPAEL